MLFGQDASVNQKFTGQERDQETNLDFFQARFMSSLQGRFLSADPFSAGADLSDPQSWNGYAYVRGNPLALVDPSGMSPFDPGDPGDPDFPGCWDDFCDFPPPIIIPPPSAEPTIPEPPPIYPQSPMANSTGIYANSFSSQYPCLSDTQLARLRSILLNVGSDIFGTKLTVRHPTSSERVVIGGAENIYIQDGAHGDGIPLDPVLLAKASSPSPIFEKKYKKQIIVPGPSNLPGAGRVVHIVFNPAADGKMAKDIKIHADIANPQDIVGVIAHTWGDIYLARKSSAGDTCAVKFD
jgi:RHS repeat-associated protein